MKRKIKSVLLFGSLLGLGLSLPGQAVEASKPKTTVVKKADSAANKQAAKPVAKKATVAKKPIPPVAKQATKKPLAAKSNAPAGKLAAAAPAKKVAHKVWTGDVDPKRLALYSASALVVDQSTGQSLLEKHPDSIVPIASISKLMTAMVVLDAKLDLNEVISISEEDVDALKGTRSRLPVGTSMTRETAMLLALMSSENRAAHALGRHYPGGITAFVAAMNRKAQTLGMTNSHFLEPTGLSSNNVSTAQDLARMVSVAARYPEIRTFSTTAEAKVELNGRVHNFGTTNPLVRSESWEIGVSKTGYISEAGRCLVMQARVADKPVIIVLLDSAGKMTRVGDANRIKRWMESASLNVERKHV
jgi:D-alanyl-D-alanine endopeptidase (penicillin-binding protein 7)